MLRDRLPLDNNTGFLKGEKSSTAATCVLMKAFALLESAEQNIHSFQRSP